MKFTLGKNLYELFVITYFFWKIVYDTICKNYCKRLRHRNPYKYAIFTDRLVNYSALSMSADKENEINVYVYLYGY